eukprot:TRINITY_DN13156_c0_g1_i4.p1 TRINITY_DN13156_c0_g1~~TRINITY_DN13156_c0_g1_i4.p1  ORF type:complete len:487 (+),score=61.73 TRINITY_DN13156_c0_g1_i4:73-1533(+)
MQGHKILLIFSTLLAVLCFAGIVFGWASFDDLLVHKGFYDFLCTEAEINKWEPCDPQKKALNRAFTAATTAVSLSSLPGGWFLDRFGPFPAVLLSGLLNMMGLLGMLFASRIFEATDGAFDVLLYSAVVQALGGSLTLLSGYQIAFLFPSMCTLLIGLVSCSFDASTIVFPTFKLFYDNGISFEDLFSQYAVFAAATFALLGIAWLWNTAELNEVRRLAKDSPSSEGIPSMTFWQQIRTPQFLAILVFTAIEVPRSNLYIGTLDLVNSHIAYRTGHEADYEHIQNICGLIIPFGFLAVPLIEGSVRRYGIGWTLFLTNVIGWVYAGLQFVQSLHVQILAAVVFAVWRAFLFSIISAYIADTFGPGSMGRTMGCCMLASGVVNNLEIPLVSLTLGKWQGNTTPMLVVSLMASLPLPLLFMLSPQEQEAGTDGLRSPVRSLSVVAARVQEAIRRSLSEGCAVPTKSARDAEPNFDDSDEPRRAASCAI